MMDRKRNIDRIREYDRSLRGLEENPNLNGPLPESGLFLHQVKRLRSLVEEELGQQAQPPRLLLEIVPSLDLYTYEERYDGTNWHILIPVLLVNSGELPAISTNVRISVDQEKGPTPTFKSETEKGVAFIEPGGFARAEFFIECVESDKSVEVVFWFSVKWTRATKNKSLIEAPGFLPKQLALFTRLS